MGAGIEGTGKKSVAEIIKEQQQRKLDKQNGKDGGNGGSGDTKNTTDQKATGRTKPATGTTGIKVRESGKEEVTLGIPAVEEPGKKKRAPAQRKSAREKKRESLETDVQQIAMLLQTITGIASLRLGQEWALTAEECKQLATPTASILDRYNLLDKMAESSDFIALGSAVAIIATPRIMYTRQKAKAKKLARIGGIPNATISKPIQQTDGGKTSNGTPATSEGLDQSSTGGNNTEPNAATSIKQLSPGIVY